MTTATKPLPAHGTYARGNGSPGRREPCPCAPCRKEKLRKRKQFNVARQQGRGARVDATAAREHLKALHATMSWSQLAIATGCDPRGLQLLLTGQRKEINRSTHNKILAVKAPPTPSPGMYIDATGLRRRLQALAVLGYSGIYIAKRIKTADTRLHLITNGKQPTVRYVLARRIIAIYDELAHTPAPAGRSRTRVIKLAADNRWAGPVAWDDDTIDDPAAVPDWTGHCGTDRGWWMHTNQRLPMCEACATAHEEWKGKHRVLPRGEYSAALARARAAASSRGVDIAHDGRELMRQGCDYDTAAARIGVTRQHLQQELQRHPEKAAA